MRAALVLALAALLCGCSGDEPAAPAAAPTEQPADDEPTWALERTWGEGRPVQLTLRLDRIRLDLSQDLLVEEELRIDDGFVAEFPDVLPDDLDGLGLVRIEDLPQRRDGAVTVRRRRLHLEPERTGKAVIAERWAFFRKASQKPDADKPLATEPITVEVDPVPSKVDLTLPPGPGIYREAPAGAEETPWTGWGIGGAVAALLLALVVWRLRRSARRRAEPRRPADALAREALARLDEQGLLERGELDAFFVYLSAILREYVERRFGVRAPERTTQEFLREVPAHPELAPHRALLDEFLARADAVKFARLHPPAEDARAARVSVEEFVDATAAGDRVPVEAA